jgi:hypothetical protein
MGKICIGPKIHDHAFTTLQSLQPVNALSQHLNFPRQAGSDLGFRLRPFGFFLSTGTSARLSQLAQPDWNLLGFARVEKLVDSTRAQSGRTSDFANRLLSWEALLPQHREDSAEESREIAVVESTEGSKHESNVFL